MSKITLKPLDDGQKAVVIPLGKTTIGRGAFLGCSDKKVSRNHAVLEVTNRGEVFLTPTHVNPCFFRPSEESPGQILKKDSPHRLEDGDSFSLLPRAYRYQINITAPTDDTANDNQSNFNAKKPLHQCIFRPSEESPGQILKKDSPHRLEDGDSFSLLPRAYRYQINITAPTDDTANDNQRNEGETNGSTGEDPLEEDDPKEEKEQPKDAAPSTADKTPPKEDEKKDSPKEKEDKRPSPPPPQLKEKSPPKEEKKKEEENHKGEEKEGTNHLEEEEEDVEKKEEEEERMEEESKDEGTLDTLPSKLSEGEEEEESTKKKKRGGGRKKTQAEAKAPKRKAGGVSGRGRKKASLSSRFDFSEDASSSQRVSGGRTSSRTNRQTRQGLSLEDFIVSDDEDWQSDDVSPRKKRRRRKKKGGDESGSDWESERKKPKKAAKGGSGSESGSDWGGTTTTTPKKKGAPKGRRRKEVAKEEESEVEADSEIEEVGVVTPKQRTNCTYGKKCYRRNQSHVGEFSHPGDSDYEEGEDEKRGTPVKKECPYGANCFRKNAQHKRDFKHTKTVRPQREAAKDKKGGGSKNSDEIDSYDLNDSFDNSADEYKPADSGSDYESTTTAKKGKAAAKGGRRGGKKAA